MRMAFATMKYWLDLSIATEWISRQMEINWLHIWQSAAANGSCNCLVIKSQLNGERGAKVTFFHLEHAYKVTHNELENRHEQKKNGKIQIGLFRFRFQSNAFNARNNYIRLLLLLFKWIMMQRCFFVFVFFLTLLIYFVFHFIRTIN